MEIRVPFGNAEKVVRLDLPADQVVIARGPNPATDKDWEEVVAEAIGFPLGAAAIHQQNLRGKRVVIITDDWGRPTPAYQAIPVILEEVERAGAERQRIVFVTASGMHDPMTTEELERKLGSDTVARYRCISHDAGDWGSLSFCGISPDGIPVWINREVAAADYRIALGRIAPHDLYGYEGGYKMILPGVAGFDTIAHHHTLRFLPECREGDNENPSRRQADAVGRMVGIDFLINAVVNSSGQPLKAFCGEPMLVHREGVAWGEREVWGAHVPWQADITLVSPGWGQAAVPYDLYALYRAARVTKDEGSIVCLAAEETWFDEPEGTAAAEDSLSACGMKEFEAALPRLALPELVRLHHKREWPLSARQIQWRIKAVRGEYGRRRIAQEVAKRRVSLTSDPQAVLERLLAEINPERCRLIAMPEASTTLGFVAAAGLEKTAVL